MILRAFSETGRQTYAMPSFPYENVYLGLLMMINRNGRGDTVDCELTWSPDSVQWERIAPGTPMIPRGEGSACDSKCLYGAFRPVVLDDEIRLYYGGNNGEHGDYRDGFFCLARLRKDGFAGYEALPGTASGKILTVAHPAGKRLHITADAAGGRIGVRVLDPAGTPIANSTVLAGDVTGPRFDGSVAAG